MRLLVIGGGVAGLVTLYTIQKRLGEADEALEVVCYERSEEIGGEWVYSNKPERFEEGVPMNSSVYDCLQTNVPLPMTTFHPDFPWPPNTTAFPYRSEMLDYIKSFANTFNLQRFIRFSKVVTNVERESNHDSFNVHARDLKTGDLTNDKFDYVFYCCGMHRLPYIPPEDDTSEFTGPVIHYHDLRDPSRMRGKRVLVVGTNFGAMDMVIVLSRIAKEINVSWHQHPPFWYNDQLKEVGLKPKLTKAISNTVHFVDGTSLDVDAIIYATGFRQVHPLSSDLQLDFNADFITPLYKNVVHPYFPKVFFVGKLITIPLAMFYIQAEFACAVLKGSIPLPPREEMLNEIDALKSRWNADLNDWAKFDRSKYFPHAEFELEITNSAASLCNCQPISNYVLQIFYTVQKLAAVDLYNYRKYSLVDSNEAEKLQVYLLPPTGK